MDTAEKKQKANDQYNATLIGRTEITPNLQILKVQPDENNFEFTAGQFTVLGLTWSSPSLPETKRGEYPQEKSNRLIRRAYSISSGSRWQEYLEFYISLVTSGELTPRLFQLAVGDRLFMGPKAKGLFTIDKVASDKNIVMVATGTGLAPYISMVRTLALGESCPTRNITILHGASYSWDLGYRAELESLDRSCASFNYIPIITRPDEDTSWTGRVGRLNEWIAKPDLADICQVPMDGEQSEFFLCGHPEMVTGCAEILTEKGFIAGSKKEPGTLHLEKYW
ncbi:MAG: ferredoxin--NADP reductase [Magnetococcales bacterium]|nr:ferredoxin--NADP reductase [Magnetococcales bacterium]